MLQLCEIINSGGTEFDEEHPDLKVILFGELFNVSSIKQSNCDEDYYGFYSIVDRIIDLRAHQ